MNDFEMKWQVLKPCYLQMSFERSLILFKYNFRNTNLELFETLVLETLKQKYLILKKRLLKSYMILKIEMISRFNCFWNLWFDKYLIWKFRIYIKKIDLYKYETDLKLDINDTRFKKWKSYIYADLYKYDMIR